MSVTKPIMLDETGRRIAAAVEQIASASSMILGVKRPLAQSSSAWERTDSAVGLTANATKNGGVVANDFDNIYPYNEIVTVNYSRTQGIIAKYGDANFTFTPSSGVEVMTKFPEFYWKRWQDGTNEYIQISKVSFAGAHRSNEFYLGRYTTSSGTRSISGASSTVSTNIATFRSNAKAIGSGWGIMDYHIFLVQMLYLVEYADYNSQSVLGQGNCSTSAQITLGGCDSLGMKSGCVTNDGAHAVIYRGLENIFGNIWQFIDGLTTNDKQSYICYNAGEYANEATTGAYKQLGYANSASASAYVTRLGYDSENPMVALPTAVGGSDSTYICDYHWNADGMRVALFGGGWVNGAGDGLFCWYLNYDFSIAYESVGSRLLLTI